MLQINSFGAKIKFVSKMADKLIMLHPAGLLDAEEVLIFYIANRRNNVHSMLPYQNYDRFVLEDMDESECLVDFRFKKDDIYSLPLALRLPEVFKCTNGLIVDSVKATDLKKRLDRASYCSMTPKLKPFKILATILTRSQK